jgi:hypothetical protein
LIEVSFLKMQMIQSIEESQDVKVAADISTSFPQNSFDPIRSGVVPVVFMPFLVYPTLQSCSINIHFRFPIQTILLAQAYEKYYPLHRKAVLRRRLTASASQEREHTLPIMRYVLTIWISGMRSTPIRIEAYRILSLFRHFHASAVSHFSFLDCFALSISMMRMSLPLDVFQIDTIQFEETKTSQSEIDGSFKLSLCASVKVSLMVM